MKGLNAGHHFSDFAQNQENNQIFLSRIHSTLEGVLTIGLLGAIQLKLQFPEKEILMFQKYEVPIRNHAMYVEQNSFSGMDRSNCFGDVLDSIPSKVIINDLEKN
ncbi:hypothetical protein [Legionella qingyii]|uniref:hypothetical protein n=1 Tax=Legionella qingyii TaxID=2184757 RepID=UPI001F1D79ED|nr:hypothetical protein [Legionella qingyii]